MAAMAHRGPQLRPIDQLRAEWEATCHLPASHRALRALASAEPAVAALEVIDLGELVASLHGASGTAGRARAASVLQAMLRSQSVHPLVPRAILQAIVPGLVSIARRLRWGAGGDWQDGGAFFADLVATAWEVVVSWSGQDRPYAVLDLLSAVRCRLRRQVVGQRLGGERLSLGLGAEDGGPGGTVDARTDVEVLAEAIDDLRGRGLQPADAAVLYGLRVLGLSMAELTDLTGRTRRQLERRRRRAERLLCA